MKFGRIKAGIFVAAKAKIVGIAVATLVIFNDGRGKKTLLKFRVLNRHEYITNIKNFNEHEKSFSTVKGKD